MLDNAKNFAKVQVSTGYDADDTSIVLETGHGARLPTAPFNAVWWNASDYADPSDDPNREIVRVTNIATDTLTVTRAQEGTSGSTKNTASKTYLMIAGPTAKLITDLSTKVIQLKVIDDTTTLTTGDGKIIFCVPSELNGMNLVDADAFVTTVSSSGTPTVQIRNVTDSVDMLSTAITIDASEFTSYTATTAPTINASNDDVATGDLLAIDVDAAGTGAKGLGVILTFQTP